MQAVRVDKATSHSFVHKYIHLATIFDELKKFSIVPDSLFVYIFTFLREEGEMPEHDLKIVSWNVQEKRTDHTSLAHRLLTTYTGKPSILTLQEVPTGLKIELEGRASEYGFSFHRALDKRRLLANGRDTRDSSLVTLTNLQVIGKDEEWEISDTSRRPLITLVTIPIFRFFDKWDDTAILSGALAVDVIFAGRKIRIINVHLTLTEPRTRKKEFDTCLEHRIQDGANLICGDFNTLQGPMRPISNFLVGQDFWYSFIASERKEMDQLFVDEGFENPLYGQKTRGGGQLDHILIDHPSMVNKAYTLDKNGSDHRPVVVELKIAE